MTVPTDLTRSSIFLQVPAGAYVSTITETSKVPVASA